MFPLNWSAYQNIKRTAGLRTIHLGQGNDNAVFEVRHALLKHSKVCEE